MSHLACRPLLPAGNKHLQQKWDEALYELHRMKVKSVKPMTDTSAPKTYSSLTKHQRDKELTAKIQRENKMLMEKISHIMMTTGRVDNWNYYDKKSLGEQRQNMELMRIAKENQTILLRLSQCKAHYSVRSWNKDWLETVRLMDSIACFPQARTKQEKKQNQGKSDTSSVDVEQREGKTPAR